MRFHLVFPMYAVRADEDLLPIMPGIPPKMLDECAKGFTKVIMGLKMPEEAIEDCEG